MHQNLSSLSQLFHALQNERGFSMSYLYENKRRVESDSSHYFFNTNNAIKQLKNLDLQKNIYGNQLELIDNTFQHLEDLPNFRRNILNLSAKPTYTFNLYSYDLISPIIQLMIGLAIQIKNAHPSAVYAYCFFLQWKEKVGLERSTIVRGFVNQNFRNDEYIGHINVLINEQDCYKKSFLSLATIAQKQLFSSLYQTPHIDTLHLIHKQLKTGNGSKILFDMNIRDWFKLISKKINILHNIEQKLQFGLSGVHKLSNKNLDLLKTSERLAYKLSIFTQMPTIEIEQILNASKIYRIPKNKAIIIENNVATHLHIILVGWVKVFNKDKKNKNQILQILNNNNTVLENCIISRQVFNFNATTITDTLMLSIPVNIVEESCKNNISFAQNLIQIMARKNTATLQNLESIKHKNTGQRIGEFFLKLLSEKKWSSNSIHLPYNKSLIASYLGMRREVFSRNLACLSEQGFIIEKDQIIIPNKEKLCQYCTSEIRNQCQNHQFNQCDTIYKK
ncbi:MAG: cyclic nucleotide-binding domain-containing protein [Gammaproteobacteria bacterium]|nr:cyclic nucleotide-binding domain-containing protein [Gammaproteobacteria bacterium]